MSIDHLAGERLNRRCKTKLKCVRLPVQFSLLCLSGYAGLAQAVELNTDFLRNVSGVPAILQPGIDYPSGEYYVDVMINGVSSARLPLTISQREEKSGMLCLSPKWLRQAGIFFKRASYQATFEPERGCYQLARNPHTRIEFNYGAQTLDFTIPQAYLLDQNDATRWDYGINGFRLAYNGNFNKNTHDALSAFGNINANLNIGRWVLSSNMNASRASNRNQFQTSDLTLATAISEIQGDLMLGHSQTRSELFSDFGFFGAAVRSNSSMRTRQAAGYAPMISGVATSTSRITITQNGYTLYSTVVPPGPYQLNDLSPTNNGNLVVTVEDSSGRKTVTEYPLTTLPTLLRPREANYNLALGQKRDSSDIRDVFSTHQGWFMLGSYDYGFPAFTLNLAAILSNDYQAGGIGMSLPLGRWGALSSSVNLAQADYQAGSRKRGSSIAFKYAKSFSDRTDLQFLAYRYQTQGYVEYANFRPDELNTAAKEKARYEARLSHRFDNLYFSASYWQQTYWHQRGNTTGTSLSASTSLGNVSLFLSGSHSRLAQGGKADLSASLGISVPMTLGGASYYSSNSVGYSRTGGTAFNSGVSRTVNDRLNYSLNANTSSQGERGASAALSYAFDRVQTNLQLAKSRNTTSLAGNLSGAAIITEKTGLILTKQSMDTVAVVWIKDTPGVSVNGSLPTNSRGETVVSLSSYLPANITINMDNVPDNMELAQTSFNVLPTERAIIYREFAAQHVLRYILRIKNAQGKIINGGRAETEQKLAAGFITGNGVLLMNMLAPPKQITVTQSDGAQCRFTMDTLKPNTGSVQEIRCE